MATLQRAIITLSAIQAFKRGETARSFLESARQGVAMPGFPGDFSEGLIGETEEMIELATDDLEKTLKRKLTELEREWVRLNHTVGLQDEAEEFGRRHPNLFNRHAQTNDNTEGRG